MRPVDTVIHADARFDQASSALEDSVTVALQGLPPLSIKTSSGFYQMNPAWYYNLVYREDHNEEPEDLFSPGIIRFSLWPGKRSAIIASTDTHDIASIEKLFQKEVFIRSRVPEHFPLKNEFACQLLQTADQFIVNDAETTTVIQGYPWYHESVRDALIALPGLCLVSGRFPEAKELLIKYADAVKHPGASVETALWFFWAVQKYFEHTGDIEFIRLMHHHLMGLYMYLRKGKESAVAMDEDGLLTIAACGGKPVGVQALWYNALQFMEEIEIRIGGKRKRYKDLALRVRESFNLKFWNKDTAYLYAMVKPDANDESLRPDGLLSISLPYSVLDPKRFQDVFAAAWRKLYTSFGLRSVPQTDPAYQGSSEDADATYGQVIPDGSVHPVWIGSFITAFCKVYGSQQQNRTQAWEFILPFENHLEESLLGSVSEVFDGNQPHHSRGCPSYAAAVGEILRVMAEDLGNPPQNQHATIADILALPEAAKEI